MTPKSHLRANIRLLGLLMLAAVTLAYANHFQNGFHFDDFHSIVNNPAIRDLRNFPRFFTDASTVTVLSSNRNWRPLLTVSLAIDYWLAGGAKPVYFQASTFCWFLLQLVVMFSLFRKILGAVRPVSTPAPQYAALFATACFGLHPAVAETVNYICQRAEVHSALGVVASLALFATRPGLRKYGLYLIPGCLGILAKPPAVVFAPLLLAYVYLFETQSSPAPSLVRSPVTSPVRWLKAARLSGPAFLVSVVGLVLHSRMASKTFVPGIVSAHDYIITQPYVALRSFRTFFLPLWLSADTDLSPMSSLADPRAILGLAFLAAVVAAIWATAARRELRPISFGLIWFVLGLLPTAIFPLSEVENDHRLYLPYVGLSLAATWAAWLVTERYWSRGARVLAPVAVTLVLTLFASGVWARNEVWRSEESLWRDVTLKSPANGRGWMNYGVVAMTAGRMQEALICFQRALPLTPNYSLLEVNLGVVNGAIGNAAEADRHFMRAIALAPEDPSSYTYYGRWLAQAGRKGQAIAILELALTKDGDHGEAPQLLQSLLSQASQVPSQSLPLGADPVTGAEAAARQEPTPENYVNLSLVYHQRRRFQDSIRAAQQALRLRPSYPEAYNNIAAAYEELHDWDGAIRAAGRALELKPDFQLARNNLEYSKKQKALGAK